MAVYQSIFVPTSPTAATLFTGTLGAGLNATIQLSTKTLFAVVTSAAANIRFGNATRVPTATTNDWPLFSSSVQEWDTGSEFDRINIFSSPGATYWVYVLSATK